MPTQIYILAACFALTVLVNFAVSGDATRALGAGIGIGIIAVAIGGLSALIRKSWFVYVAAGAWMIILLFSSIGETMR